MVCRIRQKSIEINLKKVRNDEKIQQTQAQFRVKFPDKKNQDIKR